MVMSHVYLPGLAKKGSTVHKKLAGQTFNKKKKIVTWTFNTAIQFVFHKTFCPAAMYQMCKKWGWGLGGGDGGLTPSLPQPVKFLGQILHTQLQTVYFFGSITNLLSILYVLMEILPHLKVSYAEKKRQRLKNIRFSTFIWSFFK